jgi:hypothetical protein
MVVRAVAVVMAMAAVAQDAKSEDVCRATTAVPVARTCGHGPVHRSTLDCKHEQAALKLALAMHTTSTLRKQHNSIRE